MISFHPLLLVQHLFYIVVAKTGCKSEAVLTSSGERRAVILSSLENRRIPPLTGPANPISSLPLNPNQPASAEWYKDLGNDQKIIYRESDKSSRGVRLVPGSQTDFRVSLNNISPGDSGTYCCSLVKEDISGGGGDRLFSISAVGGPGLRIEPEFIQITGGKTLTLNCTLTQMDLPTTAKWYKELSNDPKLTYRERYQVSRGVRLAPGSRTDFSISLSNMEPDDNGTYRCFTINKVLQRGESNLTKEVAVYVIGRCRLEREGDPLSSTETLRSESVGETAAIRDGDPCSLKQLIIRKPIQPTTSCFFLNQTALTLKQAVCCLLHGGKLLAEAFFFFVSPPPKKLVAS
uniref:Ig-like domain-containing protein n=1 Tax=Pseudonaja textilis TaxID=8673 RepID=A0A670ZFC0_PSETE